MSRASRRASAAAPRARQGRQSAYQIEKGLRRSLESVDDGLKRFLLSLQESGMVEGVQGYRAMQMVLVQQRLWAQSHSRTQLVPIFKSIAKTAEELHRIFAAYADVMMPLKELDRITQINPIGADSAVAVAPPASGAPTADDGAAAPGAQGRLAEHEPPPTAEVRQSRKDCAESESPGGTSPGTEEPEKGAPIAEG